MNKSVSAKVRGLGRGLESLLGPKGAAAVVQQRDGNQNNMAEELLRDLAVDQLEPCRYQPRRHLDPEKLQELSDSIKAQGLIQPIIARPMPNQVNRYEIIAGERRWRAAQLANLKKIPVVVRELDDRTVIAMALIENIQREDLNPLEEAQSLHRLIDEFGLTHAQAAEAIGRSRASVSNLLRLLSLPTEICQLLQERQLEMGHARALLTLTPELAIKLAFLSVEHQWSVREMEFRAQQFAAGKVPSKTVQVNVAPQADIAALQARLSESLATRVTIHHQRNQKGRLVIHYCDLDTLDGVLRRLDHRNDQATE